MSMYGNADVYVFPAEVWSYAKENKEQLQKNIVIIAEDGEYEVTIEREQSGDLLMSVLSDGKLVESERLFSEDDAVIACRTCYSRYFGKPTPESEPEEYDVDTDMCDHEIALRESELLNSIRDLVDVVSDYADCKLTEEDELDILTDVCGILSGYGIPVYYPMWVEDEDGNEVFVEYPYEDVEEIDE